MTDLTPTPASEWQRAGGQSAWAVPVQLPSGNVALLRRPGLDTFMKLGVIPNSLMGIITDAVKAEQGPQKPGDDPMQKMLDDPCKLEDLVKMVDDILVVCCVEPTVKKVPANPNEVRDP